MQGIITTKKRYFGNEVFWTAYSKEIGEYACYGEGTTEEEAIKNFKIDREDFLEMTSKDKGK